MTIIKKPKPITRHFYQDGGHGWLKVSRKELIVLGIDQEITTYSYAKDEFVFLEEDCDLETFIVALNKIEVELKYIIHTSSRASKVRNYNSYKRGN